MEDFLTFNTFITPKILIVFYYLFSLILPLFLWKARFFIADKAAFMKNRENRLYLYAVLFLVMLCSELCLRMVFEAMIGYFDMHDYLYKISKNLQYKG